MIVEIIDDAMVIGKCELISMAPFFQMSFDAKERITFRYEVLKTLIFVSLSL